MAIDTTNEKLTLMEGEDYEPQILISTGAFSTPDKWSLVGMYLGTGGTVASTRSVSRAVARGLGRSL